MWPRAHRNVDILRTVSLASAEWRGAGIHGHVVVIWIAAVWASQWGLRSLPSKETEATWLSQSLWTRRKTVALTWNKYSSISFSIAAVYDWLVTESIWEGSIVKGRVTHQVGAEAVIDWLHRLAWVVEMNEAMLIVSFKGGSCGDGWREWSIFITARNFERKKAAQVLKYHFMPT